MTFAKKLDFLMTITKTSNSTLAHNVMLDASYISRLRRGERKRTKNNCIIQNLAAFLVQRIREDYQKKALADAMEMTNLPQDIRLLTNQIIHWLTQNEESNAQQVGRFLSNITNTPLQETTIPSSEDCHPSFPDKPSAVYYGIEGKREASEYFLSEVVAQEKPQTLLLFSDEETTWMTEDPKFTRRWAKLMNCVLKRGNRIRIIHTISRNLDEMLCALSQ
ncbi:MAG: hypothetical protein ACOX05_04055 [Bacillota bacterium]|jgi:hypothetical protein